MKPSLFHGIYLSLIALSTFFYFTKRNRTDALYEQLSDSLTHSSNALNKMSEGAYKSVEVNVEIESRYEKYLDLAKFINATTDSFVAELDSRLNQSQINKDYRERFQNRIYEHIAKSVNSSDLVDIKKKSTMNYFLKQNSFWNNTAKISNIEWSLKSKMIKNNALIDQYNLTNYCLDRSAYGCGFYGFRLSMIPSKITIVKDDSIYMDISLSSYSNKFYKNDVYVNGELLKQKEGNSFIKIKNLKAGEHKIDLLTTVRNYSNGKFDTIRDIFYYEVLPKCGKNCRSNQ